MKICKVIKNNRIESKDFTFHIELIKNYMSNFKEDTENELYIVKMGTLTLWLGADEFNKYFEEVKNIFEEKEV